MQVNVDEARVCSSKELKKGHAMTARKALCMSLSVCVFLYEIMCVLEYSSFLFECLSTRLSV